MAVSRISLGFYDGQNIAYLTLPCVGLNTGSSPFTFEMLNEASAIEQTMYIVACANRRPESNMSISGSNRDVCLCLPGHILKKTVR